MQTTHATTAAGIASSEQSGSDRCATITRTDEIGAYTVIDLENGSAITVDPESVSIYSEPSGECLTVAVDRKSALALCMALLAHQFGESHAEPS